ncbi:tetratricopeptide repeat protein [Flavobacteriaceae bacterium R38]|nr:tetratricopeptide repeat protein [Flavobacteriaceae bacterium R38]
MKKIFLLIIIFPFVLISQSRVIDEVQSLIDKKQFSESEQTLKAALKDNKDDAELLEKLGDVYSHQKRWNEALVYYKKLKNTYPNVANYHYKYGGALGMRALTISKIRALFSINEIKNSFIRAIELEPDHIDAHWALIESYVQIPGVAGGSKQKAIEWANHLQEISAVDGHLAKGYIYEYKGDPELAEENYRKAIKVGGSLKCYQKLTDFYESKNQPLKAIKNIEAADAKHQRNALHYQIGKVCADYNVELDKGIYCLERYISNYTVEDGVPLEWAYYRLAQIYRRKNDKNEAIKWIDKAIMTKMEFKQAIDEKQRILSIGL